jgi:hypothetical protein
VSVSGWVYGTAGVSTEMVSDWGHIVLGLCVSVSVCVSGWVYGTAGVSTGRVSDRGHVVLGLCVSVSGWV